MIKEMLYLIRRKLDEKKELEYLEYINQRDIVIYNLTKDWTLEEIESFNKENNTFLEEIDIKLSILEESKYVFFNLDDYEYLKKQIVSSYFERVRK